jgi:hypothetical protein
MPEDTSSIEASSELATHLRRVHFSLVVVCLVILSSTFLVNKSKLDSAIAQAEMVTNIVTKWDPSLIEHQAASLARSDKVPVSHKSTNLANSFSDSCFWVIDPIQGDYIWYYARYFQEEKIDVARNSRHSQVHLSQLEALGYKERNKEGRWIVPKPNNIEEFKSAWNFYSHDFALFRAKSLDYEKAHIIPKKDFGCPLREAHLEFVKVEKPSVSRDWSYGRKKKYGPNDYSGLFILSRISDDDSALLGYDKSDEPPSHYASPIHTEEYLDDDDLLVRLPVFTKEYQIFTQSSLFATVGADAKSYKIGEFGKSFPDLFEISKSLTTLSFDQLVPELERQRNSLGDGLSVFGAKVASRDIRSLGAFIVFAIQVYFWIHLSELNRKMSHGKVEIQSAWIGVYKSTYSKMVYYSTAIIFPFVVGLFLTIKLWNTENILRLNWLPIVASILLLTSTIGLSRSIVQFWRIRNR